MQHCNTTTYDDALNLGAFDHFTHIDVMKVDIEGFGKNIFAGTSFFESKYAPVYIFMEFNPSNFFTPDDMRTILLALKNHGYELLSMPGQSFGELSLQNNTLNEVFDAVKMNDLLFVHGHVES